jgi:ADP-ribose pyrophosphatase YjhB (NUDIX family)
MTAEGPIPFTAQEEAEWDAREAAYVPPTPIPAPTKEQLLAELQALTAKINALG